MTVDERPTMTALQLARVAKENDGDCFYENRPVCVRTADGGLHRVVGFDWDGDRNCFMLTATEAPVRPVTPPEPAEDGAYWFDPGDDTDVWHRDDSGMTTGSKWYRLADGHEYKWAEVCGITDPAKWVRLIPDPADSAPALPWTTGEHKDRIAVTDNHLVWVNLRPDYHTPEEAELRAAAILRAAREARQS